MFLETKSRETSGLEFILLDPMMGSSKIISHVFSEAAEIARVVIN